jgi:hypothetical protein
MGLKDLKPAPGEGSRAANGCVLAFLLHLPAMIAVVIIGDWLDRGEGTLFLIPFLALLGFTQWIYLGPTAWLLRRIRAVPAAKGVVIGGAIVTLANVLFYGGLWVVGLQQEAESQRILQYQREHPIEYLSADGVITLVDDTHFEFRRDDDGTVVSLLTWDGLDYIFLKNNGGYEKRTRDMLKPGVHVNVDYSHEPGKPPRSASIVRVYEEGRQKVSDTKR